MSAVILVDAPVTPDQRRQRLIDAAVDLDSDSADLDTALRDRLLNDTSHAGIELNALLRCAAWRDLDHLSGHLADVADAEHAVRLHGAITGHEACCSDPTGAECDLPGCRPQARCATCEAWPHERLDQQTDQLLGFLRYTVSDRAVTEYLRGVA